MSLYPEDDVHAQTWEHESSMCEPDEWELWVDKVEAVVGHSLDGNLVEDGYSIDNAYEAWEAGQTPGEYSATIVKGA